MADSTSDAYLAEIVAGYSTVITVVTCNIAAAVLVFYDYALTFDQEVRIMWRARRLSSPALLFYVVRYAAFFSSILIVLDVTEWPGQNDLVRVPSVFSVRCAFLIRLEMALSALLFLSAARESGDADNSSQYTFTQSTAGVSTVLFTSCSLSTTISDAYYAK
ncbi:hypothetical protein TRAPUB_9145 [Trametes pubescens]|uniref:DUF6533 domain-containing protein n=1 Tax=Trametes pubescens TaxID=154538 RepID=A0A1M2W345_TRAPU|nr:hypothetical protein TRAPUB_9145 [Trametes pubescens]